MSAQSVLTAAMGSVSIADSAENNNESVMFVEDNSAMPVKSSKGTKKATRAGKNVAEPKITAKTGVEESMQASSFIEPEDDDFEVKIVPAAAKATRGKKRKSEEKHEIPHVSSPSSAKDLSLEPQPKRRATRSRASNVRAESIQSSAIHERDNHLHMIDGESILRPQAPASKKGGKGRKKRGSSTVRKASATSTASMASLRAPIPNDEEIEAALVADLDRPLTDEESDAVPQPINSSKTRRLTRTNPTSRNVTASVAPTRQMTRVNSIPSNVIKEPGAKLEAEADNNPGPEPRIKSLPLKAPKSRKPSKKHANIAIAGANQVQELQALVGSSENDTSHTANFTQSKTRQTSHQVAASKPQEPAAAGAPAVDYPTLDMNSSALDSRATEDDSGHETDASVLKQDIKKRGPRKGTKKPKGGRKAAPKSRNIEDIVQPEEGAEMPIVEPSADAMMVDEPEVVDAQVLDEPVPTKTTKKKTTKSTRTKTAKAKELIPNSPPPASTMDEPWTDEVLGESTPLIPAITRVPSPPPVRAQTPVVVIEVAKASTKVPSPEKTPSPLASRQSSDAENQPPSSRPSALRPPLNMQSPSKAQTIRIPLAASTPTASPSKRNISKLQTSMPWKAVELEKIFLASPNAEKENVTEALGGALTSPEKKLTVEEWIYQNARESEERLRSECERSVGRFEGEGLRALKSLEGIRCLE